MPAPIIDEKPPVTLPAPTSGAEKGGAPDKPEAEQEAEFEQELQNLENGGAPAPVPPPARKSKEEELKQATFTAKSVIKRIRDLGGDPASVLGEDTPAPTPEFPAVDTSKFVTRDELKETEVRKISKSEGEFKVIMWYVKNKDMSVEDAHLLANKNKIKKTLSEVNRSREATPSNGGGGAGQDRPLDPTVPELPEEDKRRLRASNMVYDPAQKAYVGKKMKCMWNGKEWVNAKI